MSAGESGRRRVRWLAYHGSWWTILGAPWLVSGEDLMTVDNGMSGYLYVAAFAAYVIISGPRLLPPTRIDLCELNPVPLVATATGATRHDDMWDATGQPKQIELQVTAADGSHYLALLAEIPSESEQRHRFYEGSRWTVHEFADSRSRVALDGTHLIDSVGFVAPVVGGGMVARRGSQRVVDALRAQREAASVPEP